MLGVSGVGAAVFLALVDRPDSGVEAVASAVGESGATVEAAVRDLVREGILVRTGSEPSRYRAVSPASTLRPRLSALERDAARARTAVDRLETRFERDRGWTVPADRIEVVRGTSQIAAVVRELQEGARYEILTFDTPPYVSDPASFVGIQATRVREGTVTRGIYDRASLAVPGRVAGDIAAALRHGEQCRVVPVLPTKLVVVDDTAALVPESTTGDIVDASYLIHPGPLLDALRALFETYWQAAVPLTVVAGEAVADSAGAGSAADEAMRALVVLLAAGLTDTAIARSLGIGVRTAQRRVSELMRELRVDTRFQAGIAAAVRGWI